MKKEFFLLFFVFLGGIFFAEAKAGDIYYSDGTSSSKILNKKNPAGIVLSVKNGKTEKILSLTESSEYLPFAKQESKGYFSLLETSRSDGNENFGALLNVDLNAAENLQQEYPAFAWCKSCRDGGFDDWYLPAVEEMILYYRNFSAVEKSLSALKKSKFSALVNLPQEFDPEWAARSIWMKTSTQSPDITISVYEVNVRKGKLEDHHNKAHGAVVRAVRKVY